MTKHQLARMIDTELAQLNKKIDWKIISGYTYKDDARRHKLLLAKARQVNRKSTFRSWMYQMRTAVALF